MTRQPRILHLTTTAISLDWLLAPQLHAFSAAGFEVSTASAGGTGSDSSHVESLRLQGLVHHQVPSLSRNLDLRADLRALRELHALLGELRPDILHTHNPKPGVLGRVLGRAMGIPIVVNTVHGLYAQPTDSLSRRGVVYGLERIAATCSDAELIQNPEDVSTLHRLGIPGNRLHLLGNGIDLDRFGSRLDKGPVRRQVRRNLGIDPTVPTIGMVGRMVWEKGYREFFEAIAKLRSTNETPFEVVVVGPNEAGKHGAVDQRTIDQMTDLGVRFLGSRDDVDRLLCAFDVFALPSYREGFPRAAMEASAMGIPVVASDIRGCRQVVLDGETGFLVAPRRSDGLARALSLLLADSDLRHRMGENASRRAAAEFDQERVIARTLAVYRRLLDDAGLPQPRPSTSRYSDSIDLVALAASNPVAETLAA